MIATTTVRSSPRGSSDPAALASPSAAGVLRVGREIENIGERVPVSKKRITWRFVFADSEQVHTVTLEHSRISAKKRLRLDGRRLYTSEQYCPGDWRYEFPVSKTHAAKFCVAIKDVKATVVDERTGLDSIYQLFVDGHAWGQLEDRKVSATAKAVWSRDRYARRVVDEKRVLTRAPGDDKANPSSRAVTAQCMAWTFAFGLHGTIHKLELRDLAYGDDTGEFVVILDARPLVTVNHDDIDDEVWEYGYTLFDQHTLSVVVTLESEGTKKYEFFIDGCAWKDLSETEFVLQPGWTPVYSRSRGTTYFRNETTGVTEWERQIMSRDGSAIDVPRRMSTMAFPPPTDRFDADGLMRLSGDHENQLPEPTPMTTQQTTGLSNQHQQGNVVSNQHDNNSYSYQSNQAMHETTSVKKEVNLLDFSEMAVHVSPTAAATASAPSSLGAFDPFAHIASQPPQPRQQPQQQQPPRSNQPPPIDLLL
jgi:hypothetical protein